MGARLRAARSPCRGAARRAGLGSAVARRLRALRGALLAGADAAAHRRPARLTVEYGTLKAIHEIAAALSITGFFARGLASLLGAAWVRGWLAKTLPHVVDSVLLI